MNIKSMTSTASSYENIMPASPSPLDLLQRRINFIHQRYGSYVGLNLIQLESDEPIDIDAKLKYMLRKKLHPGSTLMALGSNVIAIVYAGIDSVDGVDWLSQGKLNDLLDYFNDGREPKLLLAKSGSSSLRLAGVTAESLIQNASLALDYSAFGRSVSFPFRDSVTNNIAA